NNVEVSALFARHFHLDYLRRRTVELCWGECLAQPGYVRRCQPHDQIQIMRKARLSVNDDRHTPADHVGYAQRVQSLGEHQKEISFGHTRKSCERPDEWLRRSNRDVPCAMRRPSVAGRNSTV